MCNILKLLQQHGVYTSPWLLHIQNIINDLGLSNVWQDFGHLSITWLRPAIKLRLCDLYTQNWMNKVNTSTQCINYRIFKSSVRLDSYLTKLPYSYRISLAKFRCLNNRLPVVVGRYSGIERQNRLCSFCNLSRIGDEFHYLFECPKMETSRRKFIKSYYRIRPNTLKMYQLFNTECNKELLNLARFSMEIMKLHLT